MAGAVPRPREHRCLQFAARWALMLVGSRSSFLTAALPAAPDLGLLPRDLPLDLPFGLRPRHDLPLRLPFDLPSPAEPPVRPTVPGARRAFSSGITAWPSVIHCFGRRAQEHRSAHPRTWLRPTRWRVQGSARAPRRFPGRETCKCVRAGSALAEGSGVTHRRARRRCPRRSLRPCGAQARGCTARARRAGPGGGCRPSSP